MDSLENLFRQDRKRRSLKLAVVHIPGDDFVVLSHALNHQILDQLAHPQLELVKGIGHGGLDHLAIAGSPCLDLVKEQPVLFGEGGAEALVEIGRTAGTQSTDGDSVSILESVLRHQSRAYSSS